MTRSSYKLSLINSIAVKKVDNIDIAIQAYGIKSTRDLTNKRFILLDRI